VSNLQSPVAAAAPRYVGVMARTGALTKPSTSPAAIALRTRLADLTIWLLISAPILINVFVDKRGRPAVDIIGTFVALVLIGLRHRWPTATAIAGLVGVIVATAAASRPTVMLPLAVVLLFNAAVRSDRRRSYILWAAGLAAFVTCVVILAHRNFFGPELLAGLAWPTLAVAAGDAVRSRREALAVALQRAERAERTREAEARRRVAEERLHIARELHDVIAHRIAVVNVQAGVAAHLMRSRPDQAEAALAVVRSSAGLVLDELAGMLGVLRADEDSAAPVDPTPTLAEIPALIDSFASAGLAVTYESSGETRPVTSSTALAVYRTVQEALTNAHKHGDGYARVRIANNPHEIHVTVTNRSNARPSDDSGFGLIGMRERINAAGGILTTATSDDGTYTLEAMFPLPVTARQES